jgi:hypothetical protein
VPLPRSPPSPWSHHTRPSSRSHPCNQKNLGPHKASRPAAARSGRRRVEPPAGPPRRLGCTQTGIRATPPQTGRLDVRPSTSGPGRPTPALTRRVRGRE